MSKRIRILSLLAIIALALLIPAREEAGPLWDRIRGCTSEGLVKNETDLKSLAQYKLMRDKIKERNRRRPRARVVITGDSIAAYFQPAWIKRYLPGKDVANRGIPGDTTFRLLNRIDDDVLALEPDTVIISIGGNDLLNKRCPDRVLEYTALVVGRIREKRPGTRIIFASLPPTAIPWANKMIPDYNDELEELAKRNGAAFISLWKLLADEKGKRIAPRFQADSIHINEQGYERWAGKLLQLMK